jgi:hypothetical protein
MIVSSTIVVQRISLLYEVGDAPKQSGLSSQT